MDTYIIVLVGMRENKQLFDLFQSHLDNHTSSSFSLSNFTSTHFSNLLTVLRDADFNNLKEFPSSESECFSYFLNQELGLPC